VLPAGAAGAILPRVTTRILRLAPSIAVLALGLAGDRAGADVVRLKNGQKLEGNAIEANGQVTIHSAVGTISVPSSIVLRVEPGSGLEEQAAQRLRSLRPEDVDGRVALALELEEAGASTLAQRILLDVLQRDPDHPVARRALGYVRCEERWLTEEECHRAQGEVLYDGQWVRPDQRSMLEAMAHQRRQHELERLRASIEVETAQLQAEREAAAMSYQDDDADAFGYPFDPYYGGAGVPYWPYYGAFGVAPFDPMNPNGRFGHDGRHNRPSGFGQHGSAPGSRGFNRGQQAVRGPLHHQGGAPPRPLMARQNRGSYQRPPARSTAPRAQPQRTRP
jgi:hypothetical protein